MEKTQVAKGVYIGVLACGMLLDGTVHTETAHYVPITPIVHNGGQVITATAAATVFYPFRS